MHETRAKSLKCCLNSEREATVDDADVRTNLLACLQNHICAPRWIDGGREEPKKRARNVQSSGRVVYKCKLAERRPVTPAEHEHELIEECMSFGIYV